MAWLGEDISEPWAKRMAITIDADKIDAGLVNFTVPLRLTAAAGQGADDVSVVFDDLGAASLKIAVTTDDGTTQCYCEVAYWDDSAELAVIWAKIPAIDDVNDTVVYLYFDPLKPDNTAYVNLTDVGVSRKAWDEYYLGVWHLNQAPGGANSVKNSARFFSVAHGTPQNSPTLVDGKLAKAFDFERASGQYISYSKTTPFLDKSAAGRTTNGGTSEANYSHSPFPKAAGSSYHSTSAYPSFADDAAWQLGGGAGDFTLELWTQHINLYLQTTNWYCAYCSQYVDADNLWYLGFKKVSGGYNCLFVVRSGGTNLVSIEVQVTTTNPDNTWNHIAVVRSGNDFKLYWNGVQKGSTVVSSNSIPDLAANLVFNRLGTSNPSNVYLSQIRLSNVARYTSNFTPHNDYHVIDANTQLYIPCEHEGISTRYLGAVSVEALIKYEDRPTSGQWLQLFYDSTYNSMNSRCHFAISYIAANDSRLTGGVRTTATGTFYGGTEPADDLTPGQWYHVALVADSNIDRVRMYRNGVQTFESTTAFGILAPDISADTPAIARYTYSLNSQNYDGLLEEVRFSKIGRSAAWEKALYNACFDTLIKDYAQLEESARTYIFEAILAELSAGNNIDWNIIHPAGTYVGFCPVVAEAPSLEVESAEAPGGVWLAERPGLAAAAEKPSGAWSATKPELES